MFQYKFYYLQRREICSILKRKTIWNFKPSDNILFQELNNFIIIHIFQRNFLCSPSKIISSSKNIVIEFQIVWIYPADYI